VTGAMPRLHSSGPNTAKIIQTIVGRARGGDA